MDGEPLVTRDAPNDPRGSSVTGQAHDTQGFDHSRHYVCVDQDGDLEDGECLVGYQRDGIKDSTSVCAA